MNCPKSYGAIALVFFMPLAGCDQQSTVKGDPSERLTPHWRALKDGSQFASVESEDGDSRAGMRCWPKQVGGYLCVTVGEMTAGFRTKSVGRSENKELPDIMFPYATGGDGYSCSYVIDFQETIARGGKDLAVRTVRSAADRWSADYVKKYMAENDVHGSPYFKCLEILDAMSSIETLSTTSITRKMVE